MFVVNGVLSLLSLCDFFVFMSVSFVEQFKITFFESVREILWRKNIHKFFKIFNFYLNTLIFKHLMLK